MSDSLKAFFTAITNDEKLQKKLYNSAKISEVADIANKLGFKIQASEILQAQAGRVLAILDEEIEDIKLLASGLKAKTGAQWGRGGGGFLDNAGFWIIELPFPIYVTENTTKINSFIKKIKDSPDLKDKILNAKTFSEVALFFCSNGFDISVVDLMSYQAQKILALTPDQIAILADS